VCVCMRLSLLSLLCDRAIEAIETIETNERTSIRDASVPFSFHILFLFTLMTVAVFESLRV
jgi:hypothetical protein